MNYSDKERKVHLRQNLQRAKQRKSKKGPCWKMNGYRDKRMFNHLLSVAMEIGAKQKWKCAISGDPLSFSRGGKLKGANPKSCVIDRIDSNIGYTESNIQLLTHEVNITKGELSMSRYVELVTQISDRFKKTMLENGL